MNNRSLICCKPSRPTPSRAELTSHPAIPVGISDVSMRLMPTHRMSGQYSRGKVPKVVVFSSVFFFAMAHDLSHGAAGWHCYLSWVPPCRLRGLTSFLLHSLWNWSRLRGRVRMEFKDKDFAVSAAMLWSASSRCIESHRYPSCRS